MRGEILCAGEEKRGQGEGAGGEGGRGKEDKGRGRGPRAPERRGGGLARAGRVDVERKNCKVNFSNSGKTLREWKQKIENSVSLMYNSGTVYDSYDWK